MLQAEGGKGWAGRRAGRRKAEVSRDRQGAWAEVGRVRTSVAAAGRQRRDKHSILHQRHPPSPPARPSACTHPAPQPAPPAQHSTHPALHSQLALSRQSTPWYLSIRESMEYPASRIALLLPSSACQMAS